MDRKIRRDNLRSRFLHRCLDLGIIWAALVLAYALKEGLNLGIPTEPLAYGPVIHVFIVLGLIWLAAASTLETYIYKRRLFAEIVNLIAALVITIAFFLTYVYFTRLFLIPRYLTILLGFLAATMFALSRVAKHVAQRELHRRGIGVRRVVIVGTAGVARRLARAFRENHALGYEFMGFVTEPGNETEGDEVLGRTDGLTRIIRDRRIDEVVVALPGRKHEEVLGIAHRCQMENIRLRVVPDLFEVTMVKASLSEIGDIPLIGLRDPVLTSSQSFVKRCFDIAVASFCLALAAPLFVIIPVAIWLDSRGRVFFTQIRVGENGKLFRMYKFRSMVEGAEAQLREMISIRELAEPVFKIRDDPRVTRVGRFLRRTSLDEVPQLINVLKGDMSMVGPRPEEVQVVRHYQLWHRERLSVKPGITGPMQVGGRGELPLDERIRLELLYINQYSLVEDLKYLVRTIPAVCRARGAY